MMPQNADWPPELQASPKRVTALEEEEVQLWFIRAEAEGALKELCRTLLVSAELDRFERMRPCLAADEFLVGRGCLRVLLGAALGRKPSEVILQTGAHGKPFVPGVSFNVSHSGGLIVIAIGRTGELGVDVEAVDGTIEALDLARENFAPAEIARIEQAADGEERAETFYRIWARKEALAKAHGQGLTLSLKDFSVDPDQAGEVVVPLRDAAGTSRRRFFLRGIPLPTSFAGALAVDRPGMTLRSFCLDLCTLWAGLQ